VAWTTTGCAAPQRRSEVHAVGWVADHFPDNSVVCHANRYVGHRQKTFVGGHALGVEIHGRDDLSFFPPVYNEDWLFLYDLIATGTVCLAGPVGQAVYNPFESTDRATREEFGDVLAEGLMETLHVGTGVVPAFGEPFWQRALDARWELHDEIQQALWRHSRADQEEMGPSLEAARRRLAQISAESLAEFVNLWRQDLIAWRQLLKSLPRVGSAASAFGLLGIDWMSTRD
jgi:hypothetical protein